MSTPFQTNSVKEASRENRPPDSKVGSKTKRTLILSDVHHKYKKAQKLIDEVKADKVIHLGDHQDNFGDGVGNAVATAKWTRDRLDAGDIILLGNHDLPYWFWNDKHDWGCGWTPDKHRAIQSIIPEYDRLKFKLWVECEGWILSHAGFTAMYADLIPNPLTFLEETLWRGFTHPLIYHVGASRGGVGGGGGVLWLDWNDFKRENALKGVAWKQIVGHTPLSYPSGKKRQDGNIDWCIDTHLHHYGIIEDGKFTVHSINE